MRRNELVIAILAVLLLAGSWGLDRIVPSRAVRSAATTATSGLPPLSQAWYCPVPTPEGLGASAQTANLGSGSVHLRLSGFGAASSAPTESDLGPGTLAGAQVAPPASSSAGAQSAVTKVEAFGQPVTTYLTSLSSSSGGTIGRCSAQPGARWLFAEASTAAGRDTYLLIVNPFQEQAGVTIRILGPNGDVIPAGLSNYQIPPASQTTLFLGDFFPETASFGLDVTANRGRLIVGRLMKVASRDGVRGLSMNVGVPAPSLQWIFAGGQVPQQGQEQIVVANPSSHEALVSESFQTQGGGAPAGQQNVTVPAGAQIAITSSDEVPGGTQHGTIIQSVNNVPVVAERVTTEGAGNARGYETVFGVPEAGASWVVPAGSPAGGTDTLGVVATGLNRATFAVTLITGGGRTTPPALANLGVDPGSRGSFDLTPYLNGQPALALVTASTGSIAVENDDALPAAYRQTIESEGSPGG